LTATALAAVAIRWALTAPPAVKSTARTVAEGVAARLAPADIVVSTEPELVPVMARYLPGGLKYHTPGARVADPGVTDWRDALPRIRAARAATDLEPLVAALPRGHHLLLITPMPERAPRGGAWLAEVRRRTRE
jgi:hypothetical protein